MFLLGSTPRPHSKVVGSIPGRGSKGVKRHGCGQGISIIGTTLPKDIAIPARETYIGIYLVHSANIFFNSGPSIFVDRRLLP